MRVHIVLWAICIQLCSLVAALQAQEAPQAPQTEEYLVGTSVVTGADVDAIMGSRKAFAAQTPEMREQALRTLLAETAISEQFERPEIILAPELKAALTDAKRQVLFQVYLQSEFTPGEVTSDDIDAYVAAHPEAFEGRVEYRFQRFLIRHTDSTKDAIQSAMTALQQAEKPDLTAVETLVTSLAGNDVEFSKLNFWTSSESMDPLMRARLEQIDARGGWIDAQSNAVGHDIVLLHQIDPAPVDPKLVVAQIQNRIVQDRFLQHRQAVIFDLSQPILDKPARPDVKAPEVPQNAVTPVGQPRPVSKRALVGIGLLSMVFALMIGSVYCWWREARARRQKYLDNGIGVDFLPSHERVEKVQLAGMAMGSLMLALIGVSIWALSHRLAIQPTAVVIVGGMVLGTLASWIMAQPQPALGAMTSKGWLWSAVALTIMHVLLTGMVIAFA